MINDCRVLVKAELNFSSGLCDIIKEQTNKKSQCSNNKTRLLEDLTRQRGVGGGVHASPSWFVRVCAALAAV